MSETTTTTITSNMSNMISTISLILFIIITIAHFLFIKIKLSLDDIQTPETFANFTSSNLPRLAIYIAIVFISQFILNAVYLGNKCNNASGTIGIAAFYTFIPWLLIFGVVATILIVYPGFKSAFSDVIGYFIVAGKSNELFSHILVDQEIQEQMENDGLSSGDKSALSKSAEAIMKICGNKSVLINQINPENFMSFWKTIKPLIKPSIKENDEEITKIQTTLLDLVVLRDNIGEAFWYIYSAILISSIVYFNLATQGCVLDVETVKANREKYISDQEQIDEQTNLDDTIYIDDQQVQE